MNHYQSKQTKYKHMVSKPNQLMFLHWFQDNAKRGNYQLTLREIKCKKIS